MNWFHRKKAAFEKRFFPERARFWRRWKQHDAGNVAAIDHRLWATFLGRYLRPSADGVTRVAYREVRPDDLALLDRYISACEETKISTYGRNEQFAFWANLYNALTVRIVLTHYPLRSIKDVGWRPVWLGGGPWNPKLATVEGVRLSLNDIEHRVLRRNWRDPLIHYAVNCASISCPNLRPEPFTGIALAGQLAASAREFIAHPRAVQLDPNGLAVCSIYEWFKEDFGGSDRGVIAHLVQFAPEQTASKLKQATRIDRHRYDWRLNDAATA